ncbi:MAG TPA: hypothetical protein DCR14_04260 [Acidimicrobiaceae bacterium]|nr:hypothetical protein [Acidimicrobiaceae bacterium]
MISRIRYMFREMWASLSRNLTLTAAAIITSTISLLLFGLTLLMQRGFDNQLSLWTGDVEMIVYVKHGATPEEVQLIRGQLEAQDTVIESVSYCDEACTFADAQRLFAADPEALKVLTIDIIPSAFKIKPVDRDSGSALTSLKEIVGTLPNVVDVRTPDEQVEVLSKLRGTLAPLILIISLILLAGSVLLIWNTIRTAMFARRREIEVMKLVGATNWFIRLPFMLEGLVQGIVGGLMGSVGVLWLNSTWTGAMEELPGTAGLKGMVVTDGFPLWVCATIVALGALVGAIGSGTAATKFLDV